MQCFVFVPEIKQQSTLDTFCLNTLLNKTTCRI